MVGIGLKSSNYLLLALEDVAFSVLLLLQLLSLEVSVVESLGKLNATHVQLRLRRNHVRLVDAPKRAAINVVRSWKTEKYLKKYNRIRNITCKRS